MIIGALLVLGFISVPCFGGRLSALVDLRLRGVGVAAAAFAVQILIVNVLPGGSHALHSAIHIATYVVLAGVIAANLRLPGLPLIALGGALNAIAIFANGGVMPASERALRFAGMDPTPAEFTNSALVEHARVAFLGDIFAVPSWVPWPNVFSVGDILLVAGAWVLLHRVCRRRELAVSFFEQVAATRRSVLLRLGGDAPAGVELVVDDGSRAHRFAPLPAPRGGAGVLAFAAPAELLGPRARFAAAIGPRLIDLPAPRPR